MTEKKTVWMTEFRMTSSEDLFSEIVSQQGKQTVQICWARIDAILKTTTTHLSIKSSNGRSQEKKQLSLLLARENIYKDTLGIHFCRDTSFIGTTI